MGDKLQGHYARLALVDADGNEMEKHFARDFTPLSNLMKRPDDEAWVAAKWGDKFGIKVWALPGDVRVYKVFADGTLLRSFYMNGGLDTVLKEVCTRTIGDGYGGVTRAVYQPLVFAQPKIQEKDERPLAQQMEGTDVDKLGRITLEVWDAIKTAPVRTMGTVATAQSFGGGMMNEKALIKKGAFASTTKLGSEERVVVQQGGGGVSEYKTGYNKLETLELRYGHVSQLLILGCPVERFRVQQNPDDIETIELDDEEEDKKDAKGKKRGAAASVNDEKKGGGAGVKQENKRVKTEPGTAATAAASSSSGADAGGGGGGGGDDDDDGVWDLT